VAGETRSRMVDAAVSALQRHGVDGMSFTEVLAASGAARGAIYHHFPGGKAELVAEAAARNGDDVRAHLAALPAPTPQATVDNFFSLVRPVLADSAAGAGCAVAAATVGQDGSCAVAQRVFATWIDTLADRLCTSGIPQAEAHDLATTLITLLEGAHVMCRAAGSLAPFEQTARTASALTANRWPA
jgi:TetR/AcrR family transcriptional regulator, lmrAB and yxaGH operons repressor